tara:strand:- start:47933 stop:48475 length:543 start_codon:yes stop_codon:yes gene_type:complete
MCKEFLKSILILFSLFIVGISCNTNDPFEITPPNFDSVPPATSIAGITPIQVDEGVTAYIHEEGSGEFFVTVRDEVQAYITLRTEDGEIIYSSFQNNREEPSSISMQFAGEFQNDFTYSVAQTYTPGLKIGLLGMQKGEFRTLVVAPEKGYSEIPTGSLMSQFREDTLIYEIRITRIFPD